MWQTVLQKRKTQIQQLPKRYLLSFANDMISNLTTSRYEKNKYSEDNNNSRSGWSTDLAIGNYSSFLLTGKATNDPLAAAPTKFSPDDIALHLLALSYRSMDDELSCAKRKHALDTLRNAFERLDYWKNKWESDKERRKRSLSQWKKRLSPEKKSVDTKNDGSDKDTGGEEGEIMESSPNKRLRMCLPEIVKTMSREEEKTDENSGGKNTNDRKHITP